MGDRFDASPDSLAVMLPLPPELAVSFPEVPGNGPPHVTLLHAKPVDDAGLDVVLELVAAALPMLLGETLELGPVAYFDNEDERVAYASIGCSHSCCTGRDTLAKAASDAGLPVSRMDEAWVPHATLAYLEPGTNYTGPVPTGSWTVDSIEVWRGDGQRYMLGADGRMDRIARKGEQWVALSADGTTELGTYDSEAEARERLRQVEAAKTARADARSDDEKAEIRKRWHDDGPNMGAAGLREWLDSPFSGPNRKSGDERERARRVADRALRLLEKSTEDWTDADYSGALQVLAFIERMSKVEQGEPLKIDGREGPSARDASLRDWGYDPRQDARADRQAEAPARRSSRLLATGLAASLIAAPAVHTESRVHTEWVHRADKAEVGPIVAQANGWRRYQVIYSKAGNVQDYVLNGRHVREYRDPAAIFAPESLASGVGIPWELRHSKGLLTPDSVRGVALGTTLTFEQHPDRVHTWGEAQAWGRDLFEAIDDDTARDVSVAYRCKVDFRPGTTDDGERFDQRQIRVICNSLASEPRGNAGTAHVIVPRADAAHSAEWVTRADALLAIARAETPPSRPVFFDLSHWRADAQREPAKPDPTHTRKDDKMTLKELLEAAGKKPADLAALLGVDESQVVPMIEAPAPAPTGEGAPAADAAPPPPAADLVAMKIGDKEYMVPPEVAAEMSAMAESVTMEKDRADQATRLHAAALARAKKAETEAQQRQDALTGMVPRADAEKMISTEAMKIAATIELAHRARGADWQPEVRQDAEGGAIPLTHRDWQKGVIAGAFGDEAAAKEFERYDAKPAPVADALYEERVDQARAVLEGRADWNEKIRQRILGNREEVNQDRADANIDPIQAAKAQARKADANYRGASQPTSPNAQGAR